MNISRLTPVLGTWLYRRTVRTWATGAVSRGDIGAVRELVAVACLSDDNVCRDTATRGLSSLVHPQAIDCFCEEVIRHNDSRLTRIAQECRYLPSDEAGRALFFLATGEMDSLFALDPEPEHPLLGRGYAKADRGVKEGICAAAIASKNAPVLADVLATRAGRRTNGWTPSECEVLIAGRMQENRQADLWRELFLFPPSQALRAIRALKDAGFVPPGDELTLWQSLLDLLPDTWAFPVPECPGPDAGEQPRGHPIRMCFSPQGDLLATSGPVPPVSGFMMCAGGPSCNRSMQDRLASGRLPSLVIPPVLSVSVTIWVSGRGKPDPVVPAGITRPHLNVRVFLLSPLRGTGYSSAALVEEFAPLTLPAARCRRLGIVTRHPFPA